MEGKSGLGKIRARKINLGRLVTSGFAYRGFILVLSSTYFSIASGKWKWAIPASLGWAAINTVAYFGFHYLQCRAFPVAVETKERNLEESCLGYEFTKTSEAPPGKVSLLEGSLKFPSEPKIEKPYLVGPN